MKSSLVLHPRPFRGRLDSSDLRLTRPRSEISEDRLQKALQEAMQKALGQRMRACVQAAEDDSAREQCNLEAKVGGRRREGRRKSCATWGDKGTVGRTRSGPLLKSLFFGWVNTRCQTKNNI